MEIKRECPICSTIYEAETQRLKHGRQTTCSRECSYILRSRKLEKKTEFICPVCGEKFKRSPAQIKGKYNNNFCSRFCHYKGRTLGLTFRTVEKPYNITEESRIAWRKGAKKARETRIKRNNYGHTEATRAKLSEATSLSIAEGRLGKRSNIEKIVGRELEILGINFICQYPIRNPNGTYAAVLDFFIPSHNVGIEINGTFWHSDPRFFPDGPIHKIQKHNAIKWSNKIDICFELGIQIIEIWEYDIKKNVKNAVSSTCGFLISQ